MCLTVEKVTFLFQQNVIQSFRLTVWLHTHPGTSVFELGLNSSRPRLLIFHKISPRTHHTICNKLTDIDDGCYPDLDLSASDCLFHENKLCQPIRSTTARSW